MLSCRPARRRSCWWRRARRRIRSSGSCAAPPGPGAARVFEVPPNARVVDWLSYTRTMPLCDAVVCHAGHGTVARALASGVPVVACGHAGDQAENAARIRWAGVGVSLPRRFQTPRGVRLAVRRLLADERYRRRAAELRDWATANDGAAAAADAVEELAERSR